MSILQKKNIDIPVAKAYNKSELENDLASCGIDYKDSTNFPKRNELIFKELKVEPSKENVVAVVCERMEAQLSKRELAFLLAKSTLIDMMKEKGVE